MAEVMKAWDTERAQEHARRTDNLDVRSYIHVDGPWKQGSWLYAEHFGIKRS